MDHVEMTTSEHSYGRKALWSRWAEREKFGRNRHNHDRFNVRAQVVQKYIAVLFSSAYLLICGCCFRVYTCYIILHFVVGSSVLSVSSTQHFTPSFTTLHTLLMWIHSCAFLADCDPFLASTSTTIFNQLCKLCVLLWQARSTEARCSLQHHTCVQMNMTCSPRYGQVAIAATCFVSIFNIANYAYMHIKYTQ